MTVRQMQDRTCCATSSTLCSGRGGNEPSSSLRTMYPQSQDCCRTREGKADLPASGGAGLGLDGMASICESSINVVMYNEPKMLSGSNQKWYAAVELGFPSAQSWTQGHRRIEDDLTHLVIQTEHGKPVVLPFAGRQPQGAPMGLRVWEEGKSECRVVMTRIGVAVKTNINPRESGQTSLWSLITREFE
jgi:hypothetical protein